QFWSFSCRSPSFSGLPRIGQPAKPRVSSRALQNFSLCHNRSQSALRSHHRSSPHHAYPTSDSPSATERLNFVTVHRSFSNFSLYTQHGSNMDATDLTDQERTPPCVTLLTGNELLGLFFKHF